MVYAPYSQTTSGWEISTDPEASPDKRWRAVHPLHGERFFAEHDKILEFTVRHMTEQFRRLMRERGITLEDLFEGRRQ